MQGFKHYRSKGLNDRYLPPDLLKTVIGELGPVASLSQIGASVEKRPIYGLKVGNGDTRVLMWSQMHGNESTTTRALLDILKAYKEDDGIRQLMAPLSLFLIPMLNPDGAHLYTRNNANEVDLNRDARARTQVEIQALFDVFNTFKPHYCFNLHDQRTRYGVGIPPVSAAISFLAPTADPEKSITPARHKAMALIAEVTAQLRQMKSLGVGRYDDTFNPDAVGDTFVSLGVPSILFETGFFPEDYDRKESRWLMYQAILLALKTIAYGDLPKKSVEAYFGIPENTACFADIILKNARTDHSAKEKDLILNYREVLKNGTIDFIPAPLEEEYSLSYIGHAELDMLDPIDREQAMADPKLRRFIE